MNSKVLLTWQVAWPALTFQLIVIALLTIACTKQGGAF